MPPDFLISLLARYSQQPPLNRPHITLTFAQSTDAKIAAIPGKQLILSGEESMQMTHWLRSMHDAILIGIGTALNDDPQLNTRHLPLSSSPHNVPRPVILDSHLRLSTSCKLLNNFRAGSGRRPWIISTPNQDPSWISRKEALTRAGANIIEIPSLNGRISISAVLQSLCDRNVRSLMVEGGAAVIASFFSASVVDTLIITTAPTLVGDNGLGYTLAGSHQQFTLAHTQLLGKDTVNSWVT